MKIELESIDSLHITSLGKTFVEITEREFFDIDSINYDKEKFNEVLKDLKLKGKVKAFNMEVLYPLYSDVACIDNCIFSLGGTETKDAEVYFDIRTMMIDKNGTIYAHFEYVNVYDETIEEHFCKLV